jgi:hypothetical protein
MDFSPQPINHTTTSTQIRGKSFSKVILSKSNGFLGLHVALLRSGGAKSPHGLIANYAAFCAAPVP